MRKLVLLLMVATLFFSCSKEEDQFRDLSAQQKEMTPLDYYQQVVVKKGKEIDPKSDLYRDASLTSSSCWVDLGLYGSMSVLRTYDGNAVVSKYDVGGNLEHRYIVSGNDADWLCYG